MNNSATFNKLSNNPQTYPKMKHNKHKQRKHENIKYKSLIFLSQKFQSQGLLKNKFDKEEVNRIRRIQRDKCKSKNIDVKHDDMQLIFEDKGIAEKIRTLRKPTYSSNTTIMQRISNQIQNRTSTNFSTLSKSSKKQKQNEQRLKILKKQAQHLWQPVPKLSPNKIKQQNNMIFAEKVKKFMSTSYDHSIVNKKQKTKTDRTVYTEYQTQVDRNQNGNQVVEDCGKLSYHQLNRGQGGQNEKEGRTKIKKYDRWAAKSSMEWIGQDCGNEETVGVRQRKDKKKGSKVMNEIIVPKSSLYMSMYLRIRDKQQQTNSPNQKLLKTNQVQNNEMQINKISKLPQNTVHAVHAVPAVHAIKYLHRRMQNNKKFNNYSYNSIASKFRQKREQNKNKMSIENEEKGMMKIVNVREEYEKLYRLKLENGRKESGKGPTITIDPW